MVTRSVWVREVAGSIPAVPTTGANMDIDQITADINEWGQSEYNREFLCSDFPKISREYVRHMLNSEHIIYWPGEALCVTKADGKINWFLVNPNLNNPPQKMFDLMAAMLDENPAGLFYGKINITKPFMREWWEHANPDNKFNDNGSTMQYIEATREQLYNTLDDFEDYVKTFAS